MFKTIYYDIFVFKLLLLNLSLFKTKDILGMLLNSKKLTRTLYDNTIEFLETMKTTTVASNENTSPKVFSFSYLQYIKF